MRYSRSGKAVSKQDVRREIDPALLALEKESDPVALVSDLTGLDDSSLSDSCVRYCRQVRDFFVLDKSSSTALTEAVSVATKSGTGRWERMCVRGLRWSFQASWKVDPSSGSDVAAGTPSAPLKTWAEFVRRVSLLSVSMNVLIGGNLAEAINGSFGSAPGVVNPALTIEGVPTVLVAGSTSSTFVAPNPSANTKATTAIAGTDLSLQLKNFLRIVGTDKIVPITGSSGQTATHGYWGAPGFDTSTPANGTSVEVISLPTVPTVQVESSIPVSVKYLRCTDSNFNQMPCISAAFYKLAVANGNVSWLACGFVGSVRSRGVLNLFIGCHTDGNFGLLPSDNHPMYWLGGGSTGNISASSGGHIIFDGFLITDSTNGTGLVVSAGTLVEESPKGLGVFATKASADGILVQTMGVYRSYGGSVSTWGVNTRYGVNVTGGGRFASAGASLPSITGATGDLIIEGVTALVPPPTTGGVWSGQVDLSGTNGAGWTKWSNGGKKFVHYGTLSSITN